MSIYNVTETLGPTNKPTGLPNAQPGSMEWKQQYRAAMDPTLSEEARLAAAQQERDAAEADFQAAVQATIDNKVAPAGFVVVTHPDHGVGSSVIRALEDGRFLCRQQDLDGLMCHGFSLVRPSR